MEHSLFHRVIMQGVLLLNKLILKWHGIAVEWSEVIITSPN